MKSLIGLCVRRPIGTIMVSVGALIVSILVASSLGVEFLPDVRLPRLVVSTTFEGLPASEVRVLITIPLEDALSSLKGMKQISSVSREGVSTITLEFHWGTDMKIAAVETRELLDVVYPALPSDAKKPVVLPSDPAEEPVMLVGVFSDSPDLSYIRRVAEREVKTRLQQVGGVGSITVVGGVQDEVRVEVDQAKMAGHGLTVEDIASALSDSNFDYPAGTIREGAMELLVKAKGSVDDVSRLGDVILGGVEGPRLLVRDVSGISLATAEQRSLFQADGREGVGLQIRRRQGTSPVSLALKVRAELARLSRSFSNDLQFRVVHDSSLFISRSLSDLIISIAVGAVIAFVVVLLFVRDLGTSVILISSVPVSILISLLFLGLFGRTINVMSIGGLSLGIGMMMDNSVVILENLQKRLILEGGGVTPERITEAVNEMSASNIGSTVTSIAVFLPVIFLPGVIGAVFTDLSLSVIFCQVVSFVISITLIPVLFMKASSRRAGRKNRQRGIPGIEKVFRSASRLFFRRPFTLVGLLVLTTVAGIACARALRFEFMPAVDSGEIDVTVAMRHGTSLRLLSEVARLAGGRVQGIPGVESVYARAGGEMDDAFYLADPLERPEIIHMKVLLSRGRRMRAFAIARQIGGVLSVEEAEVSVSLPENIIAPLLGVKGSTFLVKVKGGSQEEALGRAEEVNRVIADECPGTIVRVSPSGYKPEIHLVPDRQAIAKTGTTINGISRSVQSALDGAVATRMLIDGRETDVRVLLRKADVSNVAGLVNLAIRGPQGSILRLGDLAEPIPVQGPPALLRADRSDVAYLEIDRGSAGGERAATLVPRLAQRTQFLESMERSALRENLSSIILTFGLVILLLYLVLGVQFESFVLPFLLLLSLPLSFSGIFTALFIAGKTLNLDSILGIIVLFGIAVNNSIVLYENFKERAARITKGDILIAVYRGTPERLRPILITMLSTVMAIIPVALDPTQTSTQSSMAVAIIGGLCVSTTLTLFVIPRLFLGYLRRRHGPA